MSTDADKMLAGLEKVAIDQQLHVKWPHFPTTTFLGIDDHGWEYAHHLGDNMYWRITPCCGASDKGAEHGIVCRSCYGDIPDEVSDCVVIDGQEYDIMGNPPKVWTPEEIRAMVEQA